MKKSLLILILLMAQSYIFAQDSLYSVYTGDIKKDVLNLVHAGNQKVGMLDSALYDPRTKTLGLKMQMGIKAHYDWFLETIEKVEPGEPVPYHENLGITRSEYDTLKKLIKDVRVVHSDTTSIKIIINKNIVTFEAHDKLNYFNRLKLDLNKNIAFYDEEKMFYKDTVVINGNGNGLRSRWSGFQWRIPEKNYLPGDFKDPAKITLKIMKFTIGKLERTGNTVLFLELNEIKEGIKLKDVDLVIELLE